MLPTHMFLELDTIYLPRRGCSFDAIQVAVPTISEGSVALNSIPHEVRLFDYSDAPI